MPRGFVCIECGELVHGEDVEFCPECNAPLCPDCFDEHYEKCAEKESED